jgi:hypothetical protein
MCICALTLTAICANVRAPEKFQTLLNLLQEAQAEMSEPSHRRCFGACERINERT